MTRLRRYFDKHYKAYEDTAEFYVDPDINIWKFDILELNLRITMTCYDDGKIVETRELINHEQL
jgi:hypothetical protein